MSVGNQDIGRLKQIFDVIYEHGQCESFDTDWITEKIKESHPDTFRKSLTPEQSINMYFSQNPDFFEKVGRKKYRLKENYHKQDNYVDQFSTPQSPEQPERRAYSAHSYLRSPEIRRRVLVRAQGKCEWCGQTGFMMTDGRIYLETHHVIPLSESGQDIESNVVGICPKHYREAHHGANCLEMRNSFLSQRGVPGIPCDE